MSKSKQNTKVVEKKETKKVERPGLSQDEVDEIRQAFDLFDDDKNGSISCSEVKKMFGKDQSLSDYVLNQLFAQFNKSSDQEITFDDFLKFIKSLEL